jgi:hypothetical protein
LIAVSDCAVAEAIWLIIARRKIRSVKWNGCLFHLDLHIKTRPTALPNATLPQVVGIYFCPKGDRLTITALPTNTQTQNDPGGRVSQRDDSKKRQPFIYNLYSFHQMASNKFRSNAAQSEVPEIRGESHQSEPVSSNLPNQNQHFQQDQAKPQKSPQHFPPRTGSGLHVHRTNFGP